MIFRHRNVGPALRKAMLTISAVAAMVLMPVAAQDAAPGFDGYIQSGTCANPTTNVRVNLESEEDHDVNPYLARAAEDGETVTIAYYGAPAVLGFAFATIFTDERFSLVIVDPATNDPVACGDLLQPVNDDFDQIGLAIARLNPVAGSNVQGFASVERQESERELDVISTRVRILLTTDIAVPPDGTPAATPAT